MPYSLREEDGKWCVYNRDTNENKGCSDSKEMAVQHMRALYAHEPGAKSGPLSLEMTITKAEKTSQGFIRWRARCNTGEVDSQNEKFDATFWLDLVHNFMQVQKSLSAGEKPSLPIPILDVAHYSMFLGSERMKARAGWPNRIWIDGKALMAEGFYDDTPLGKASAIAGMRPDEKRPKISICVYPDWGNVSAEDGILTYKGGRDVSYLDHLGQTMYPVNAGTDIVAEVSMEAKSTIAQDAKEVLGDEELAKELEKARASAKSTVVADGAIIKAEDTTPPAEASTTTDAPVVEEEPIEKAAPVAMTPCACGGTCGTGNAPKAEEKKADAEVPPMVKAAPVPEVKSDPLADKYEALANLVMTLSKSLPEALHDLSETVKGMQADVEALKASDTAKVKSAIDNGGNWLEKFYNPRTAADNKATAAEVTKAEPKPQPEQMDGIWGYIAQAAQKPGG